MPSAVARFLPTAAAVLLALTTSVATGRVWGQLPAYLPGPPANSDLAQPYYVERPPVAPQRKDAYRLAERLPPSTLPEAVVFPSPDIGGPDIGGPDIGGPDIGGEVYYGSQTILSGRRFGEAGNGRTLAREPYYFATEQAVDGPLLQEPIVELEIDPPPDRKSGVLQKVDFSYTWIDRGKIDDVGMNRLGLFGVFAFPAPRPDAPLIVTPGFAVRYLDGPIAPDVPPRVYDAYLELRHLRKLREWLGIDLSVTTGAYSDFERYDDSAIRISGRAIGSFQWRDDLKLVLGIVYLDRDDISMLPAAGLIWIPNDDWRMDLVFPRPRIARKMWIDGWSEDWLYLAAEFGGGSWQIERVGGATDQMTIRDYRILFGLERKSPLGRGRRIEIGYVFGRAVEYAGGTPDVRPNPTAIIRAGVTY